MSSELSLFKDYSSTSLNATWSSSALRLIPYGEIAKRALRVRYDPHITEEEATWRDRYDYFLSRGYRLRPRFRPDWKPSWIENSLDPWECEDAVEQYLPMVLDATRQGDGQKVCIKRTKRKSKEVQIMRLFSSEKSKVPNNHTVPILDAFSDEEAPDTQYIVMPLLRRFDDPDFGAVGEVVDCVSQLLEGLAFLHSNWIAHCDLTGVNIMMDARSIFPQGWHFSLPHLAADGVNPAKPLARIDRHIRYYIIDFDFSMQLEPGPSHLVKDLGGRDRDPPELSRDEPFDPFKLDVFTLGNVFKKDIHRKYFEVEFLNELCQYMMIPSFQARPTAKEAIQRFSQLRPAATPANLRRRLPKRIETTGERWIYDTVSAAKESILSVAHSLAGDPQANHPALRETSPSGNPKNPPHAGKPCSR